MQPFEPDRTALAVGRVRSFWPVRYGGIVTATLDDFGGWKATLSALVAGTDLSGEHAEAVLTNILAGEATEAQIAGFVVALGIKGQTTEELAAMVKAMHEAATPLHVPDGAIDIVGMGGSPGRRKAALNVSTMACFVASAAGATVCKHGNRKASSTSGSFDLLEALGVNFEISPEKLGEVVTDVGVGFAFAKAYHPALRHAGPVRVQLGIPTVFNVLGPLANPARVRRQLVGVADAELGASMIDVLRATGSESAWVVTGDGSLDELTTSGPAIVHQLQDGTITTGTIDPQALGLAKPNPGDLDGGDAAANAAIVARLFGGETGAIRDIVLLNAAAGLVVAGLATDLERGLEQGAAAIDSGAAQAKLDQLIAASAA